MSVDPNRKELPVVFAEAEVGAGVEDDDDAEVDEGGEEDNGLLLIRVDDDDDVRVLLLMGVAECLGGDTEMVGRAEDVEACEAVASFCCSLDGDRERLKVVV